MCLCHENSSQTAESPLGLTTEKKATRSSKRGVAGRVPFSDGVGAVVAAFLEGGGEHCVVEGHPVVIRVLVVVWQQGRDLLAEWGVGSGGKWVAGA
eukprot:COSAG04_NODE_23483_length_337_cov_1.415966_1_plen_95_part_10